jgi:hypothetical protein
MHDTQPHRDLTQSLGELESLLAVECAALKRLDRDAIDTCTTRKLEIYEQLQALLQRSAPTREHREQLERLHKAALHNQLLLVHARDSVRGTLALLTGEPANARPSKPPASAGGMRVNLRG